MTTKEFFKKTICTLFTRAPPQSFKGTFVSWKVISGKLFFKPSSVCLPLGKLVNRKHFFIKEKFGLISRKVFFPFILGGKHFSEVVKILKISYCLLIMSNLILKLLIAIYFVWIFFFQIHPLKFDLIWFLY